MREQVLLFHFEDPARRSGVRKALLPLRIGCKDIPPSEWDKPLGAFVHLETEAQEGPEASALTAEVLVLCGLSGGSLDAAVSALRRAKLLIPYKAVLTPINKNWTVGQLFTELEAEHRALHPEE